MLIWTIYSAFAFGFFLADEIFDRDHWVRIGVFSVLDFSFDERHCRQWVVPEKSDGCAEGHSATQPRLQI